MDNSNRQRLNDLLERVRQGESEAAALLVRQYEVEIRAEVRVRLRDRRLRRFVDSTDICQSVLASFFVHVGLGAYEFQSPQDLVKLLARMARNKVADQARRQNADRRDVRRTQSLTAGIEAGAVCDKQGQHVRLYTRMVRGLEAIMQGRWKESADACDQAAALLQAADVRYWYEINVTDHCQSIAWFYLGEFRTLSERVPVILQEALQRGDRFATPWFRMGYCNAAWLAADDPERARQELDRMLRDFPPQRYSLDHFLIAVAELHLRLYCGSGCEAWEHLRVAWQEVRKSGTML